MTEKLLPMRLALRLVSIVAAAIMLLPGGLPGQEPAPPHVVVISIDGLMPSAYTSPDPQRQAQIPTLRRLAEQGVWAEGVIGVLPSVTYPSHTSIVTGVPPAVHGIYNNLVLDPGGETGGGWYWYARDLQVPTLAGAVKSRGLSTAAVSWPVTVDADIDYLMPEYFRRYSDTLMLLRALSRPRHLLEMYETAAAQSLTWPLTDDDRTGLAAWMVRSFRPSLTLLHIFENDGANHRFGPGSAEARAALERSDAHVQVILDAVADAGLTDRTNIVIVSDHGFLPYGQRLNPNAAFRQAGLLEVGQSGAVSTWDAYFAPAGGSGFVYVSRPEDASLVTRVEQVLRDVASERANGVRRILDGAELRELGAEPRAVFALDMEAGFTTGEGRRELLDRSPNAAGHGFDPRRPEMHASLIMAGPDVPRAGSLGIVRMTQVAPTIARWFGVGLSPHADEPLPFEAAVVPLDH